MPGTLPPEISKAIASNVLGAGDPAADRSVGRGAARIRPAELLLHEGHRLRARDGVSPADAVRARGLARRAGGLDARPRRLRARGYPARLRRGAARRQPHARRGPRQRHAVLADEYGRLLVPPLLGEQARLLRLQGRHRPDGRQRLPDELYQAPRAWAERAYPNLIYFNEVDEGNHFAAWQEPDLFATEVRAAFRSLRMQNGGRHE